MKIASIANAYNEASFIEKHLNHIPDWVDEKVVCVSSKPWFGDVLEDDGTAGLAEKCGATVLVFPWPNEEAQRNAAQDYLSDYDWILNLEPDEFLSDEDWDKLYNFLEEAIGDAYVVRQRVFWGRGYESDPPEDFKPIIVTRPKVHFWEKRNVNASWEEIPDITLLHFAWQRPDSEIWKKISHYSHAVDFDTKKWFREVWLAGKTENVHPLTPEAIPRLIKAELPREIKSLNLADFNMQDLTKEQMQSIFGDRWQEIIYEYKT